jgi:hypothetical protein
MLIARAVAAQAGTGIAQQSQVGVTQTGGVGWRLQCGSRACDGLFSLVCVICGVIGTGAISVV